MEQTLSFQDQRLLGAGGLRGAVLEVLVAVETEAGKRAHVLAEVHLTVLVGIQKGHELIVVTLPELTLCKTRRGDQEVRSISQVYTTPLQRMGLPYSNPHPPGAQPRPASQLPCS